MSLEVFYRAEQLAVESTRGQEALNRFENSSVIVEDNDKLVCRTRRHGQTTQLNLTFRYLLKTMGSNNCPRRRCT